VTVDFVKVIPFRMTPDGLRILVLRRTPMDNLGDNFWQVVTGTCKPQEWSPLTALREVKEETGLDPLSLFEVDTVARIWLRKQDRIIHGAVFASEMSEGKVRLCEEHVDFRWETPAQALETLCRRSQREVIRVFCDDLIRDGRWEEYRMWDAQTGWGRFKPPEGAIDRSY
jgi:dihydroneopterin triphosphate diphosphatase